MNKYLFYILIGFILTSCGNSKGTFSIKGQIKQLRGGELYVYSPAPEFGHADTITVMNEEVDYSSTTSAEIPLILVFGNGSEHTVFVAPGQKIKINGDATHLKDLTFEGGESNELYAKFRKESGDKDEKSVAKLAETIIRDNPKSVVSVFLLYRHFYQTANAKKVIELGKVLQESQPDNIMLSQPNSIVIGTTFCLSING